MLTTLQGVQRRMPPIPRGGRSHQHEHKTGSTVATGHPMTRFGSSDDLPAYILAIAANDSQGVEESPALLPRRQEESIQSARGTVREHSVDGCMGENRALCICIIRGIVLLYCCVSCSPHPKRSDISAKNCT